MDFDQTAASSGWPRRGLALAVTAAGLVALSLAVRAAVAMPGAPAVLRGLFVGGMSAEAAVLLAAALFWLGAAPAWLAALLLRRPWLTVGLPVWAAAVGLAGWWLAHFSIAGAADAAVAWDWQNIGRLAATTGSVALVLIVGSILVGALATVAWETASRSVLLLLLVGGPWLVLALVVFITVTDTGGPFGLVRGDPLPGGAFLMVLLLAVGMNAAALGHALRRPTVRRVLLALAATGVLVPVGWFLLNLSLAPMVIQEGAASSSIERLLGTGAAAPLSEGSLFVRWSLIQMFAVAVLAWGQWCALVMLRGYELAVATGPRPAPQAGPGERIGRRPQARRRAAAAAHPGRTYLVLAILYGVFTVYGSLVPLEFHDKPFDAVLEQFLKTPYLLLHIQNRADLVANILLYVPLTFFAMGAWTREGARPGRWFMALCVTASACVLAVAVEFFQIYFPPRTVSLNDILAECAGSGIGVAAWFLYGMRVTRWVRGLWRERNRRRLAIHILSGYLVVLVLYELFPFDVTVSLDELLGEIRKINWVPLADPAGTSLLVVAAKTAMLVPVGYLLALAGVRRRHPVRTAAVQGGLLVLAIQILHIFIHTRYSTATDVVLGALGAGLGGWLADRFGPVASRPPIWTPLGAALGRVLRAAAALAGVGLMVWYKWQPHQFHWPREGVAACIAGWVRIPFYNQYWNTEYAATVQVAQDFAAPLALAVILVSLMRRLGRPGRVAAAVLAAGIGAGIEAGQMFFPPRAADLTTVFIAVAGGVVGVYLYDPLVRVFVKPPAVEDEADGPWSPT